MPLSNQQKSTLSYQHQAIIQKLFKENIQGELCIDHFSINVFFGKNESLFLSPTPQMAEELCKKKFVNDDANYKKDIYTKFAIYPWRAVEQSEMDRVINHVKEEKFGMRNGMMIVRNLGEDRYVMYSFATHKKEHQEGLFYFLYHSKANYIARMGDLMYNELNEVINDYSSKDNIFMPKIQNFKAIDLEPTFNTDFQRELHDSLQAGAIKEFTRSIEQKTSHALKLMHGGKVARL